MIFKRNLAAKILLFIGLPVIIIFLLLSFMILQPVKQSVSQLTTNELTTKSQYASNQIESFFCQIYGHYGTARNGRYFSEFPSEYGFQAKFEGDSQL
jgi:hypothetical protein